MSVLVIDASVALQANGLDLPAGRECRAALRTVMSEKHCAAFTRELRDEWCQPAAGGDKAYSMLWLVAMTRRHRIMDVTEEANAQPSLVEAIQRHADPQDAQAMLEDLHLINAARATARTILSRDQDVRRCFASVCHNGALAALREIHWANPGDPSEEVCTWLVHGAPTESHRALRFYASSRY